MPTYVYRRSDGTTFELFQRITDDPLTEDPETGQPVARVISGGAGVQFKGTGFYETDYVRKSSPKDSSESESSSTSSSSESASSSSSGSTETASASTSSPDD